MTLGLWTDNGSNDKGSKWSFKEVGVKHNYTLFSDGMPSSAVVTINGKEFADSMRKATRRSNSRAWRPRMWQ